LKALGETVLLLFITVLWQNVQIKETVHAFSWEPVGSKFAVIHGEAQSLSVSFFGLKVQRTPSCNDAYNLDLG
jgi:uncharacterized protein with WD repeat